MNEMTQREAERVLDEFYAVLGAAMAELDMVANGGRWRNGAYGNRARIVRAIGKLEHARDLCDRSEAAEAVFE